MEIRVRDKCKACGGYGVVQRDVWRQFWDKHQGNVSIDEKKLWFRNRGYDLFPSEELGCCTCRGTGYAESWVPLERIAGLLNS